MHAVQRLEEWAWGRHILVQGCLHPAAKRQQSEAAETWPGAPHGPAPAVTAGTLAPSGSGPVCALPSLGPGLTPGTYGPRAGDPTELSYTKPCSGGAQLCPQSEREAAPPGSPPDFFLSIYPPRTQWSSPEDGTLGSNPAGPGQPQQPPQGPGQIPHTRAGLRGHRSRCMHPHVRSVSVPETLALPSPLLHLCFSCQLPHLPPSGHCCWLPRRPPPHLYHELPL